MMETLTGSYTETLCNAASTMTKTLDKANETAKQVIIGAHLISLLLLLAKHEWRKAKNELILLCNDIHRLYPEYFWTKRQIKQAIFRTILLTICFSIVVVQLFCLFMGWLNFKDSVFAQISIVPTLCFFAATFVQIH